MLPTSGRTTLLRPAIVPHPGEILIEELDEREITQSDFAEIIGRPLKTVNAIIKGKKSITPETANAIASAFETSPEFWMNLQVDFDLWRAGSKADNNDGVRSRAEIYKCFPVRELVGRGYIKPTKDADELRERIMEMFEVESLEEYEKQKVAMFRRSEHGIINEDHLYAWIALGRILARNVKCRAYDSSKLLLFAKSIKAHSRDIKKIGDLITGLNQMGVRVLFLPHFSKTKVDGAVFWDDEKPTILMSLRYDRIDNFFFTVLHEIGHIVRHKDKMFFDDLNESAGSKDGYEQEANEFALKHLVPQEEVELMRGRKISLREESARLGVHPGIVVGALQHNKIIPFKLGRQHLERVRHLLPKQLMKR